MGGLEKILYVEDDDDIRDVASVALETIGGLSVVMCASGADALQAVSGFRPDLILLDVMMPEMDGPETLAALRRESGLEDVPAVFMTAKVQPQEVERYLALGAVDVLAKPFDPMTLADQVRAIWNRHHG